MIESFKNWVKENPGRRTVKIEIGESGNSDYFRAWAYDYDLFEGQTVNSAEEINLKLIIEKKEREQYEKLKAKYEEV